MNISLKIPESYKNIITVAIRGIGKICDLVVCTTDKKLMTFFKGCLIKNLFVDIEVKQLEPFIVYEPKFEVYYILYGDNKVVIVKEGENLEVIRSYNNVHEMVVSDSNNLGVPQLYMRTDKGFECIDIFENKEQISHVKNHETSVVYSFCVNKLQKLKILYNTEKNKLLQKSSSFNYAVMQISNNETSDIELSSNIVTKTSWLKMSNEKLVYGFTLQNNSKLPVSNFSLILLEDNKQIWPKYTFECWEIRKNKKMFDFHSGFENSCISNDIKKSHLRLNSESSVLVTSIIENWSFKCIPYFINGIVYINNENNDRVQYINTDEIMVTSNLFLDKEFEIFIKNSILIEDLVTLNSTKFISCYQIKCLINLNDLKNIIVNSFKFDTKNEWLFNSSLSWLKSIICYLHPISPLENILKVFSDSLIYERTFIKMIYTMLPDHTCINSLDSKISTSLKIDTLILDLKELRKVLKEYLSEQIIIPRDKWNNTRLKLLKPSTV